MERVCDNCGSTNDVRYIPDPECRGVHAWYGCVECRNGNGPVVFVKFIWQGSLTSPNFYMKIPVYNNPPSNPIAGKLYVNKLTLTVYVWTGMEWLNLPWFRFTNEDIMDDGLFPHECITPGCDVIVQFDDEPWCFKHSPNSGAILRGYSAKAEAEKSNNNG